MYIKKEFNIKNWLNRFGKTAARDTAIKGKRVTLLEPGNLEEIPCRVPEKS